MWSSHSQYLLIPSLGYSTVPSTSPALSPHNPTEEPLWRVPCKRGGRRKQQESDSAVLPPVIHPSAACQPVVSLCLQHFSLGVSHFFLLPSGSLLPFPSVSPPPLPPLSPLGYPFPGSTCLSVFVSQSVCPITTTQPRQCNKVLKKEGFENQFQRITTVIIWGRSYFLKSQSLASNSSQWLWNYNFPRQEKETDHKLIPVKAERRRFIMLSAFVISLKFFH